MARCKFLSDADEICALGAVLRERKNQQRAVHHHYRAGARTFSSTQQLGMHCVYAWLLYYIYFYVIISDQVFWGQIDTRVTPWDSTEIIMEIACGVCSPRMECCAAPQPGRFCFSIKLASVDFSFASRPPPAFSCDDGLKLTNHSARLLVRCWRLTLTY